MIYRIFSWIYKCICIISNAFQPDLNSCGNWITYTHFIRTHIDLNGIWDDLKSMQSMREYKTCETIDPIVIMSISYSVYRSSWIIEFMVCVIKLAKGKWLTFWGGKRFRRIIYKSENNRRKWYEINHKNLDTNDWSRAQINLNCFMAYHLVWGLKVKGEMNCELKMRRSIENEPKKKTETE